MTNPKAQADIVSAVLIVLIALGLTATVYTWGLPLIKKKQDTAVVDRIDSFFDQNSANSLPSKIEFIANNGGEQSFSIDATGTWFIHPCTQDELSVCNPFPGDNFRKENNSIEFVFFSQVSKIATNARFISLTPGASCPPSPGILGKDKSSVVCASATALHDGYQIVYKVWFRELDEPAASRGYKIDLTKHEAGTYNSSTKTIRISRQSNNQVSLGGKTLIIPEIKILLE